MCLILMYGFNVPGINVSCNVPDINVSCNVPDINVRL
jgi:hypothetical protein